MSRIDVLKTRRDEILDEIRSLEQMRRGSVVEQVYESVGKDGVKIRRGPYLLYSFKEKGKTVSRRIKDPELKISYEQQIDAFRRFQELTAQLVRIGEQIADWALSGEEALKKNAFEAEVQLERDAEIVRLLDRASTQKELDLEAWEFFIRDKALKAGARVLEKALQGVGCGRQGREMHCPCCGARMYSVGQRTKEVRSILGRIAFRRSLFVCQRCGEGVFPADTALGIEETSFSPGAQRMMARAGAKEAFEAAAQDLQFYAQLDVQRKDVERTAQKIGKRIEGWRRKQDEYPLLQDQWEVPKGEPIERMYISFDGTGVPMCPAQLAGRKGKQPDGTAKTREAKLGCVFTQTKVDEEGRPVRDSDSTTYAGAIESSDAFGRRIYAEALRRGLYDAKQVVVLTDGASYNKTITQTHFPGAIHIIDLFHAREHLTDTRKFLVPQKQWEFCEARWSEMLDEGDIENLTKNMARYLPRSGQNRRDGLRQIHYFQENTERMRYSTFREQGLFVGSGVIEAGCRSIIGERLKKSGMHWSLDGANDIIAVRCCLYSRRFEQFWEDAVG
jgi:hypothetical protein